MKNNSVKSKSTKSTSATESSSLYTSTSTESTQTTSGSRNSNKSYVYEYISGEGTVRLLGMHINKTWPECPGEYITQRLEPLDVKIILECTKPIKIGSVTALAYTDLIHMKNCDHKKHEVVLPYKEGSRKWTDTGVTTYTFNTKLYPTEEGKFSLSFNVQLNDTIIFANRQHEETLLNVIRERKINKWVTDKNLTQITKLISIASTGFLVKSDYFWFIKMTGEDNEVAKFRTHGDQFSSILSLDRKLLIEMDDNEKFEHFPLNFKEDVTKEVIEQIVNTLRKLTDNKEKTLLVDGECVDGVGSAIVSYIYANNPIFSFDEALEFVVKRRPGVTCHSSLRQILVEMFPRI